MQAASTSTSDETLIEITTATAEGQEQYQLELAPVLINGTVETPMLSEKTQSFTYTLGDSTEASSETTASSETEATVEEAESDAESEEARDPEFLQVGPQPVQKVQRAAAAPAAGLGTGNSVIPKGAIKLGGLFNVVTKSRGGSIDPSKVIVSYDTPTDNNGMPYDEIQLSGSQVAIGVWSKEQYRLDFSHSFEGRTYVNFGPNQQADGFAFVMQNEQGHVDTNGSNVPGKDDALTSANASTDGQNLGVYGATGSWVTYAGPIWNPNENRYVHYPEGFAITKSIAVEFDLYANTNSSTDTSTSAYDLGTVGTPHMAWTRPGTRAGYQSTKKDSPDVWTEGNRGSERGFSAKVVHNNPIELRSSGNDSVKTFTLIPQRTTPISFHTI